MRLDEAADAAARRQFASWLCDPYGAPCETSEVSRIVAYYRVECLTVCAARCRAAAADIPEPPVAGR
jgi:hypothetical protein